MDIGLEDAHQPGGAQPPAECQRYQPDADHPDKHVKIELAA